MAIKGFEILLWFLIIPLAAGNLPVFETGKEKDWFVQMADALICGYVLLLQYLSCWRCRSFLPGSHLQF